MGATIIYKTRTLLVRNCGHRTYAEVLTQPLPEVGAPIWCVYDGDEGHDSPSVVAEYVEEPIWPIRWQGSHSCRGCGHYIEGDWSLAPLGPEGDEMRARLDREMDRGCCDNCWTRIEREARIEPLGEDDRT